MDLLPTQTQSSTNVLGTRTEEIGIYAKDKVVSNFDTDPDYPHKVRACNSITNHTKQALLNLTLKSFNLVKRSHTLLPVFYAILLFFTGFAVRSASPPPDTTTQAPVVRMFQDIVSMDKFQVFNCAGITTNPNLHKYSLNRPKPCKNSSTRYEDPKPLNIQLIQVPSTAKITVAQCRVKATWSAGWCGTNGVLNMVHNIQTLHQQIVFPNSV